MRAGQGRAAVLSPGKLQGWCSAAGDSLCLPLQGKAWPIWGGVLPRPSQGTVQDVLLLAGPCMPGCSTVMNSKFQRLGLCGLCSLVEGFMSSLRNHVPPSGKIKGPEYTMAPSLPWRDNRTSMKTEQQGRQVRSLPRWLACHSPIHSANTYLLSSWPGTAQGSGKGNGLRLPAALAPAGGLVS